MLVYRVYCPAEVLVLPQPAFPERTDGLWQSTCFEAFVASRAGAYAEFNMSPSSQWAAYDFDGYRTGMRDRSMPHPRVECEQAPDGVALTASLELSEVTGALGLSAVIEEADGTKSYWALAHPPGRPDFHHAACFAATLPAPKEI